MVSSGAGNNGCPRPAGPPSRTHCHCRGQRPVGLGLLSGGAFPRQGHRRGRFHHRLQRHAASRPDAATDDRGQGSLPPDGCPCCQHAPRLDRRRGRVPGPGSASTDARYQGVNGSLPSLVRPEVDPGRGITGNSTEDLWPGPVWSSPRPQRRSRAGRAGRRGGKAHIRSSGS